MTRKIQKKKIGIFFFNSIDFNDLTSQKNTNRINLYYPIKCQCCPHKETTQLIYEGNTI